MSKKALYLLGIFLTILIGTILYYLLCCKACKKCCASKSEHIEVVNNNVNSGLSLFGKDLNYECADNFNFKQNSTTIIEPISANVLTGIETLKASIEKNPNQKVTITGFCTADEENTSAFPNLGFARANTIKNILVSKGISADHLEINGEIKDKWNNIGDTLLGPVQFTINENNTTSNNSNATTDLNALKTAINTNPLTLYFNTNQTEISLTETERKKVADIVSYLDKVAEAKVSCIGHTDNSGDRTKNVALGQDRADFAKQYLAKNGIDGARIISSSKAPDDPIADNTTIEGKAKNRRTVVTVQ